MKKAVLIFILAILVLITCIFWFMNPPAGFSLKEIVPYMVIILIIGFALFAGFKRLMSARRGEPSEDELSKKILVKASSVSYYISIYLWLIIMYLSDKTKMENHTLVGAGILGMALTFALCWVIIYFRGLRNE